MPGLLAPSDTNSDNAPESQADHTNDACSYDSPPFDLSVTTGPSYHLLSSLPPWKP